MIENLVRSLLRTRHQDLNTLELVVSVVTLLVVLVLVVVVGRWLWNNVLVKVFPGVKPVSVWQLLGLYVLVRLLLRNGNNNVVENFGSCGNHEELK